MDALNPILLFVMQALLTVLMLFFGFVLNVMKNSIDRVSTDLKTLNDAVLGKYVMREDWDKPWADQRQLDHDMRDKLQLHEVTLAKMQSKPYQAQ